MSKLFRSTFAQRSVLALGLAAVVGCGSIEGDVYRADAAPANLVPNVEVLLVRQSKSLLQSVDKFCSDEKADTKRRDYERNRLEKKSAALRDSAALVFGLEYKSPRWQRLADAANAAWDSSAQLSIAGADPVAVADEQAVLRTHTDNAGHYRLSGVRAGKYFVVPVMRESEYAAVQWYSTRLWLGTKRLDVTDDEGVAGCFLTAADSL